ncbi:PREDICTED: gibberellin receptor GID1A-like [Tarenaya hassleriana]|uniref:gibberellin receptor GID1A-like n=1 Tax=Tarenaya hassleriana TaxID=28532 RepID=UPI00053C4958|nr:PREDICTED: gibberellin receptor GID1A-like [Tarenaya hassleriana]
MAASDVQANILESKSVVPLNTWVLISNFKVAYKIIRRPDGTFNRYLAEFLDRRASANANPVDGVFSFDVVVDRETCVITRVYRPFKGGERVPLSIVDLMKPVEDQVMPVIVFFHGGSFAHSSVNSTIYDVFCRRIVNVCRCIVISVDYRRTPENPYPCAYEDGFAALKWVNTRSWLKSKKDSKVHTFLAGDSSGGNMVHNVALMAADAGIEVMGNILLNPMFGGKERTKSEKLLDGKYFVAIKDRDWYWRAFLPEGEDRDHPACNPFGPRGRSLEGMKNFPKTFVTVSGLDMIKDWQLAYVEGLKKAGQEVKLLYLERATIGFYLLPNNSHFFNFMNEIKAFVNADRQ